jgi:post-segregation antitoxin (ccd killing protein)
MSSVTMDMNGAFAKKIDLSAPSSNMRELIATEAERWRQMEREAAAAKKSLADRLGLSALFGRH